MIALLVSGMMVFGADAPAMTAGGVEGVVSGFKFTEGPLWTGAGGLIFSDIPADTIYRADKSVFRQPSGESNGLTLDAEGRLLACEHKNRRVSRTEKDGTVTVVAERFDGKRLNSPNDLAVRSDGTVFFTDPPYGLPGGLEGPDAELDCAGVYAVKPGGEARQLARDFKKPNGIAFSPDEKTLYIADTEGGHVRRFSVAPDGALAGGGVLYELPGPDGLKVDRAGNLWCTAGDGVHVVNPEGKRLQLVEIPERPSNCAFGGGDGKTLFVTAVTGVYKVGTTTAGILPGPAK